MPPSPIFLIATCIFRWNQKSQEIVSELRRSEGTEERKALDWVLNRVCKINERLFTTFALPPFFHTRFSPDLLPSRSSFIWRQLFPRHVRHAMHEGAMREKTYLCIKRHVFRLYFYVKLEKLFKYIIYIY